MKKFINFRLVAVLFLLSCLSTNVLAGRKWATSIENKQNKISGSSNLWMKISPSYGKYNFGDAFYSDFNYPFDSEFNLKDELNITMVGLGFEISYRSVSQPINSNFKWSMELPFGLSVHQREFEFNHFMIISQIIPTGRLTFTSNSGMEFSPFIGIGGGVMFNFNNFHSDAGFRSVFNIRFGGDVMFDKSMGIAFVYTHNSIKTKHEIYEYPNFIEKKESVSFNQFTLSLVFHL